MPKEGRATLVLLQWGQWWLLLVMVLFIFVITARLQRDLTEAEDSSRSSSRECIYWVRGLGIQLALD
jgi:hypothetical protein